MSLDEVSLYKCVEIPINIQYVGSMISMYLNSNVFFTLQNNEVKKQDFLNYLDQYHIKEKIINILCMLYNEEEEPLDVIKLVYFSHYK